MKPVRWMSRVAAWVLAGAGTVLAAAPADVAEALAPSLVRVEYHVRFDGGDAPFVGGVSERCPNCGSFHGSSASSAVEEERPFVIGGFVLGPDAVLVPDLQAHPRFVRRIEVVDGEARIEATPDVYYLDRSAVRLKLAKPLAAAKPLAPAAQPGAPAYAVTAGLTQGRWSVTVKPLRETTTRREDGRVFIATDLSALLADAEGRPVGFAMNGEWTPGDVTPPERWPALTAAELREKLAGLERSVSAALMTATLRFRSPRQAPGGGRGMMRRFGGDEEDAVEMHAPSVLVSDRRVLVLASLPASRTARLERIELQPPEGAPVTAKFLHSLTDYGALVAELDQPRAGALPLAQEMPGDPFGRLLLLADLKIQGGQRKTHFQQVRVPGVENGWKGMLLPSLEFRSEGAFLFDRDGRLLAMPVARRGDAADLARGYGRNETLVIPVRYLAPVFAEPAKFADAGNVPLSAAEEDRVAWMGVELQPLDANLAKANQVSHLTDDGDHGAIVSYVYPDSPAAAAGVEAGWILLRIQPEGAPRPVPVEVDRSDSFGGRNFPWERLDELPEQYYEEIPAPWPEVQNQFIALLTELGMGRSYEAEFFANGQVVRKAMKVVEGPRHFGTAPNYKWEAAGLTACDLTYEVRNYLNRKDPDPGVIVSRLTPGSKASTAGLKPFELITHVNDAPVHSAAEFGRKVEQGGEFRLSVRRMTKERIVTLTVGGTPPPGMMLDTKPVKPAYGQ